MCIRHNMDLVSMHIENFIKIHPFVLKILRKNTFFTSIKGHNSVVYKRIWPLCNPNPLLPDINVSESGNEALTDRFYGLLLIVLGTS